MIKKLFIILSFFCSVCVSSVFAFQVPTENYTADAYTVLLIHGDQADGTAGILILDSETTPKIITAVGNAQVDTAQYQLGAGLTPGSILFDGTGDYCTTPDSADWDFGTGAFTIDFWVRHAVVEDERYVSHFQAANDFWTIANDSNRISMLRYEDAYIFNIRCAYTFSANTWYHIAVVRIDGANSINSWRIFVDGVAQNISLAAGSAGGTMSGVTGALEIGGTSDAALELNGWIDELRISKGIARDWAVARRVINITYGVNIGSPNMIGTPLWSCKIKLQCFWRNLCG